MNIVSSESSVIAVNLKLGLFYVIACTLWFRIAITLKVARHMCLSPLLQRYLALHIIMIVVWLLLM